MTILEQAFSEFLKCDFYKYDSFVMLVARIFSFYEKAKRAKNYFESDKIKDFLKSVDVIVEDLNYDGEYCASNYRNKNVLPDKKILEEQREKSLLFLESLRKKDLKHDMS